MIKESNAVKYKIIIYKPYNHGNLDRNVDKTSFEIGNTLFGGWSIYLAYN